MSIILILYNNYWQLTSISSDDDECIECDELLESLEEIDDEADSFGIDFVKKNDPHAAR